MKRLKVGITAFAGVDAHDALWSSGLNQNIVYLALLLQRLPEVELSGIVAWPAGDISHPLADLYGLPTLQLADACQTLDVIIELGARAETEFTAPFRERGGKLVSYMAGNAMMMNFEDLANGVTYGDYINAVFTDVDMPGEMDGLQLAFHAHERWPDVGFVVASGKPDLSAADMPCGTRFFSKPYDTERVIDHIRGIALATA